METAVGDAENEGREDNLVGGGVRAEKSLPAVLGIVRPSVLGSCHQSGKSKEWDQARVNNSSKEHVAG